jgi:hypothetical protein
MSSFTSKKAKKKVIFKFEIMPEIESRISDIKATLNELNPDLEYNLEEDLAIFLEKHVGKAEKNILKMETDFINNK